MLSFISVFLCNTSWLPGFARAPPSLPASLSLDASSFLPKTPHKMYRFSRQFMKFPELLKFGPLTFQPPSGVLKFFFFGFLSSIWHFPDFWFVDPLRTPVGPSWGGVGQMYVLAENESHIYPNMCAKFGCGPTVVSKKGGGTDRQTKGRCSFI